MSGIEEQFGVPRQALRFRNEKACSVCSNSIALLCGTVGRTVVAEMIAPLGEPEFLQGVKKNNGLELYQWFCARSRQAKERSDLARQSALQIAMYKVAQGLIDPRDVQTRFGGFDFPLVERGVHA